LNDSPKKGPQEPTLSPAARRRQRERTERLETILAAAENYFASEGYNKTRIESIADAAEVSVGTVYFYFKNKEDLLIKLLDTIGYQLRVTLGQAFRSAPGGREGLERASQAFFCDFCRNHRPRLTIIFRDSVGISDIVESHRKKIFGSLIADLEKAVAAAGVAEKRQFRNREQATLMAAAILGTYERLAYHFFIWKDEPAQAEEVARHAVTFILGGLTALTTEEPCI
jgi:AcrR family transcriptional regulator